MAHFLSINRHYREVARQLSLEDFDEPPPIEHTVLVLVGDLHKGVVQALQYARTLSPVAKAVYVETDPEKTRRLEEKWGKWGCGLPLVVLSSPYRMLLGPLLDYLDHLLALGDHHMVTIIIPEFIPAKWWQHLLHNQTALVIKGALLFRKNVVVTDVPYHLSRWASPSGGVWYTEAAAMEATLHVPPPLDLTRTFSRFRTWGEDPVNRLGEGVLRRAVRVGEGWHGYELRWTGAPDDPRITVRVPGARRSHVLAAAVAEARRICGADLDLAGFYIAAKADPVLGDLVARLHGLRPTLMPEPFEMLVGSICAQQVNLTFAFSLRAALVRRFGTCLRVERGDGVRLPGARAFSPAPVSPSSGPCSSAGGRRSTSSGSRAPSPPARWISAAWRTAPTRRSSRRSPRSAGSVAGRRSGSWRADSAAATSAPPATSRCERRSSISTTGAAG